MSNVCSFIGFNIRSLSDDALRFIGKNKQGLNIYRRLEVEPILRGFKYKSKRPDAFQATEFFYTDDAGNIIKQSLRRVGRYGEETSASRVNVAEFTKFDKNFAEELFHEVTMKPKAKSPESLFSVLSKKGGLRDNLSLYVSPDGSITSALLYRDFLDPTNLKKPLENKYQYIEKHLASYAEDIANKPHAVTKRVANEDLSGTDKVIKFDWSLKQLKDPNFYKELAGPGDIKTFSRFF